MTARPMNATIVPTIAFAWRYVPDFWRTATTTSTADAFSTVSTARLNAVRASRSRNLVPTARYYYRSVAHDVCGQGRSGAAIELAAGEQWQRRDERDSARACVR